MCLNIPLYNFSLRIIDDDIDISKLQKISDEDLEVYAIGEDAPQIVGVFDERPAELIAKEDYKNSEKWKMLAAVDGTITINNFGQDGKMKSSNRNSKRDGTSASSKWGAPVKVERSPDASPPRRRQNADASPTRKHRSPDASPPRRRQNADISPTRKYRSPDASPPRRRQSPDASPTRRRRSPDKSPPRRRRSKDASPPRRRRSRDMSPVRRRRSPDASPPRKRTESSPKIQGRRCDSDLLPRRQISSDRSPPRKRRSPETSFRTRPSPPRRIKVETSPTPSTKRKKMSRWSRDRSIAPPEEAFSSKMIKTLDGKSAGLQDAKSLRQESSKFRKREEDTFESMSADLSGRNAEAVMRDRRTGRVRDFEAEAEKEDEKIRKELERKAVYDHWGKG